VSDVAGLTFKAGRKEAGMVRLVFAMDMRDCRWRMRLMAMLLKLGSWITGIRFVVSDCGGCLKVEEPDDRTTWHDKVQHQNCHKG